MIKIVYTNTTLTISGHANSDKYGKDLVCAAISGIYLGALSWFKSKDIKLNQTDDKQQFVLVNKSLDNKNKLALLIKQLKTIAWDCPKSIKITKGK